MSKAEFKNILSSEASVADKSPTLTELSTKSAKRQALLDEMHKLQKEAKVIDAGMYVVNGLVKVTEFTRDAALVVGSGVATVVAGPAGGAAFRSGVGAVSHAAEAGTSYLLGNDISDVNKKLATQLKGDAIEGVVSLVGGKAALSVGHAVSKIIVEKIHNGESISAHDLKVMAANYGTSAITAGVSSKVSPSATIKAAQVAEGAVATGLAVGQQFLTEGKVSLDQTLLSALGNVTGAYAGSKRLAVEGNSRQPEAIVSLNEAELHQAICHLESLQGKYRAGTNTRPNGVNENLLDELIFQNRTDKTQLTAARLEDGTIIIRSLLDTEKTEPIFAIIPKSNGTPVVGKLTDRGLEQHWPKAWQDYSDMFGQRLLDHCCGLPIKVKLLREKGIEANGVDITAIDPNGPSYLQFGRAERLPYSDGYFHRVESRMGVMLWSEKDVAVCRQSLAEMVRVTADGGLIRISPVNPQLMTLLAGERNDVTVTTVAGTYGAYEIHVKH